MTGCTYVSFERVLRTENILMNGFGCTGKELGNVPPHPEISIVPIGERVVSPVPSMIQQAARSHTDRKEREASAAQSTHYQGPMPVPSERWRALSHRLEVAGHRNHHAGHLAASFPGTMQLYSQGGLELQRDLFQGPW